MAAATVTGRASYAALAQNNAITLPDTTGKSGQLLIVSVGIQAFPVLAVDTPYRLDGWHCLRFDQRGAEFGGAIWAKVSDGTETTFQLDIQTDTRDVVAYAWIIDGWYGDLANSIRLATNATSGALPTASGQWIDGVAATNSDFLVISTGATYNVSVPVLNTFAANVPDENGTVTSNGMVAYRAEATVTAGTQLAPGTHSWTNAGTPRNYSLAIRSADDPTPDVTPELVGTYKTSRTNAQSSQTITIDPRSDLTLAPGKANPGAGAHALLAWGNRTNGFTYPTVAGWTLVGSATNSGGTVMSGGVYTRALDGTSADIWSSDSDSFRSQSWAVVVYDETDGFDVGTAGDNVEFQSTSTATPLMPDYSRPDTTEDIIELGVYFAPLGTSPRLTGIATAGRRIVVDTEGIEPELMAAVAEFIIENGCATTAPFTRRGFTLSRGVAAITGTIGLLNSTASATFAGSGTPTQADETATATGAFTAPTFAATGSPTQEAQTSSASGNFDAPTFSSSGAPTQANQTAEGVGNYDPAPVSGSGAASQANQTAAGSGTFLYTVTGSGSPTQANQTATGSGEFTQVFAGSGAITQGDQSASGSATFTAVFVGSGSPTQGDDTSSGSGNLSVTFSGSGAPTQANQTATGVGSVLDELKDVIHLVGRTSDLALVATVGTPAPPLAGTRPPRELIGSSLGISLIGEE